MGRNRKVLAERELPERTPATGRMLVDLCENVHIHHRDLRTEFSVAEFRQYVDHLNACRADVDRYLADNPDYREGAYPNPLLIATGNARLLDASPKPHVCRYWPRRARVELIEPHSMGSVHVHWRDFRLHMTIAELEAMAETLSEAARSLAEYRKGHGYKERESSSEAAVRRQCARPPKPYPGPGHFRRTVG